ncbi:MAG: hypothetical protein OXU67_11665 [Chloroflexota bacterium]|nr:hypothetical protein [Chloroflexota bacterium]
MDAHFVLDHNFPWQVTKLPWPEHLRLTRLAAYDASLIQHYDDWQILDALNRRGDVDGFITNDANILQLPREMVVLSGTRLTLVVADGVGHDPIRATGLVMLYLGHIVHRLSHRAQIFTLRPGDLGRYQSSPAKQIDRLADHQNIAPPELIAREREQLAVFPRESSPLLPAGEGRGEGDSRAADAG